MLTPVLEEMTGSIESTSKADFEALGESIDDLANSQARLMEIHTHDALQAIAAKLGVTGANVLNIWMGEDGLNARTPYINSDGDGVSVHWGTSQSAKLSGEIAAMGTISGHDLVVSAPGKFGEFNGAILKIRIATREGVTDEDLLGCDSFEEMKEFLKVMVPYLNRKDLLESGVTELVIQSLDAKTNKAGDPYFEVTVSSTLGHHRMSLPMSAQFAPGDKILIEERDGEKVVVLNGEELSGGGNGWIKMHELEVGKPYTITQAKAKSGEYGGYDLICPAVPAAITANSQIAKFLEGLASLDEVCPAKPLVVTVSSIRSLNNGHKQAITTLKHGNSSPLGALLAKKGTGAPTNKPASGVKVEDTSKAKAKAPAAMTPEQIDF
jgi:hypothetical protein